MAFPPIPILKKMTPENKGVWAHIWSRCPKVWDILSHRLGTVNEGRGFQQQTERITHYTLLRKVVCQMGRGRISLYRF